MQGNDVPYKNSQRLELRVVRPKLVQEHRFNLRMVDRQIDGVFS